MRSVLLMVAVAALAACHSRPGPEDQNDQGYQESGAADSALQGEQKGPGNPMTVDTTLPVYRERQEEGKGTFQQDDQGEMDAAEDTSNVGREQEGRLGNFQQDTTSGSGVEGGEQTPPAPGDTVNADSTRS